MKKWCVKIGFTGCENKDKVLYQKSYIIKAETADIAEIIAYNGLAIAEYHNFKVLETKEVGNG